MYKVWINCVNDTRSEKFINSKELLKMLVDLAGGGMTTSQTINAMNNKYRLDFVNRNNGYDVLTLKYQNNKIHFKKTNEHPEQQNNEFFAGNTTLKNGVISEHLKPLKTVRIGQIAYCIEGFDLTTEYGDTLKPLFINNSESGLYESIMKSRK